MPQSSSARKRLRQSDIKHLRNKSVQSAMKTAARKVVESIAGGDEQKTETLLRQAISKIDRAAAKGAIHKNEARRRASRLAKKVHKAVSEKPGAQEVTG